MRSNRAPEIPAYLWQELGLSVAYAPNESLFNRQKHKTSVYCGLRPDNKPCATIDPEGQGVLFLDENKQIQTNLPKTPGVNHCLGCPIFLKKIGTKIDLPFELTNNFPHLVRRLVSINKFSHSGIGLTCEFKLPFTQKYCEVGPVTRNEQGLVTGFARPKHDNCLECPVFQSRLNNFSSDTLT